MKFIFRKRKIMTESNQLEALTLAWLPVSLTVAPLCRRDGFILFVKINFNLANDDEIHCLIHSEWWLVALEPNHWRSLIPFLLSEESSNAFWGSPLNSSRFDWTTSSKSRIGILKNGTNHLTFCSYLVLFRFVNFPQRLIESHFSIKINWSPTNRRLVIVSMITQIWQFSLVISPSNRMLVH